MKEPNKCKMQKLERYLAGSHALPHEVSAFIYIYIYIDVFSFYLFQNPHNSLLCSRSIIYLATELVLWFWYVASKDSLVPDIREISFSHCFGGDKHMSELKFKIFLSLQSGNANIGSHIMMENIYFSFCYNPTTNYFRVILRDRTILHFE